MGFTLLLLLLSVPLGVLITVTPVWAMNAADYERMTFGRVHGAPHQLPALDEAAPATETDWSHHPATCLAVAAHRARAYLAFIAARWHIESLDPMTWIIAGRLRDRFETALLGAIGAVKDWLAEHEAQIAGLDPRTLVERERLRETLAELIGSLPAFSSGLGWECHYRVENMERIGVQLAALAAGVERHRQAALHPPTAPFR